MNSKGRFKTSGAGTFIPPAATDQLLISIIVLFAIIISIPLVNAGFVWYDDDMMVFKNPLIQKLDFDSIKRAFSMDNIVHYHPLVYISFTAEHSLFGLNPKFFHITNIILHCLNSVLVFRLILALKVPKIAAFTSAILFAVHPLHVESFAWITERKDVLYAFFFLSSLVCYLKFKNKGASKYYLFSLSLFLLSCLSKSMAVTLPVVLIALDYFFTGRKKIKIKDKLPFFLISLVFIFLNFQTAYYKTDMHVYSLYERISFVFYAVLFYPIKMLLPFDLSAIYPYPPGAGIIHLISPIVFLALLFILYKMKIRSNHIKFGLWFYLITILPVLPIFPFGISLTADRFSYIPMLGLLYAASMAVLDHLMENRGISKKRLYAFASVFCGVILIFTFLSFNRASIWKNTETLMKDLAAKNDDNHYAYFILGNYYSDNGRMAEAIDSYKRSLMAKPVYSDVYFNLGNAYYLSGDFENAILSFMKAIELNPLDEMAYNNLGLIYERSGRMDSAIENYRKSASLGYEPAVKVLVHYGVSH